MRRKSKQKRRSQFAWTESSAQAEDRLGGDKGLGDKGLGDKDLGDKDLGDKDLIDRLSRFDDSQSSLRLAAEADRLFAIIDLVLIVGVLAVLLKGEFDYWVGAPVFLALACFIFGLVQTMLHIRTSVKLLLHADALVNGALPVPNVVRDEEFTAQDFEILEQYAQNSYHSQTFYVMLGVVLGALGMVAHLWQYAWRAGSMALGFLALVLLATSLKYLGSKLFARLRPSPRE